MPATVVLQFQIVVVPLGMSARGNLGRKTGLVDVRDVEKDRLLLQSHNGCHHLVQIVNDSGACRLQSRKPPQVVRSEADDKICGVGEMAQTVMDVPDSVLAYLTCNAAVGNLQRKVIAQFLEKTWICRIGLELGRSKIVPAGNAVSNADDINRVLFILERFGVGIDDAKKVRSHGSQSCLGGVSQDRLFNLLGQELDLGKPRQLHPF